MIRRSVPLLLLAALVALIGCGPTTKPASPTVAPEDSGVDKTLAGKPIPRLDQPPATPRDTGKEKPPTPPDGK